MNPIITELYFARVILHIKGKLPGCSGEPVFVLSSSDYGEFDPSESIIDKEAGTFDLSFNIFALNNNYPLYSGNYYLKMKADGKSFFVNVCDDLHYLNKISRMVFKYDDSKSAKWIEDVPHDNNYSFWFERKAGIYGEEIYNVLSMIDPDTDAYYLFVTSEFLTDTDELSLGRSFSTYWSTWRTQTKKKWVRWLAPYWEHHLIKLFNKTTAKRPKNKKPVILFASQSRGELGGNMEYIYKRMKERGLLDNYEIIFDFKSSIKNRRGKKGTEKLIKELARADIIMIDDFFPRVYLFDYAPDVKFVQVWHACGAFKTLGMERNGKPGAPKINTNVHKCYTHMPVTSLHSARHHAEAFALPLDVFVPTGVPRTDIFFDEEFKKKTIESIKEKYPVLKERNKIYLYAPTFRGNNAKDASFPFEKMELNKWGKFLKERNEVLILKMHPFVTKKAKIPKEYKDYIIDMSSYREVNEILFVADTLITDYSSVMYEYSLLKRPMYFYAFDQKAYELSRDFYESYEETVPGNIYKTVDGLLNALAENKFDSEALDRFIEKNFLYTDGKATDRFIDEIILKPMAPRKKRKTVKRKAGKKDEEIIE